MLTQLQIGNFKCIAEADIQLAPLTLLAGLNGAGKSTVIQSILMLRQSQRAGWLASGMLETAGDLVDLGTANDILFEGASEDSISFMISDEGHPGSPLRFDFKLDQVDRLTAVAHDLADHQLSLDLVAEMPTASLALGCAPARTGSARFHYINAERVGPRKSGAASMEARRDFNLGTKGEFALHALHEYRDSPMAPDDIRILNTQSSKLGDQVEAWLSEISPGVRLSSLAVQDADLVVGTFSFGEEKSLRSREFRSTNVGFGLSYVLPILLALLGSGRGSFVLLENPEAHVHPAGQTRLGELCALAAASGVQIIVETHSDHFMDGIRLAVRRGLIGAEGCKFHYFSRNGTRSEIASPELDSAGRLSFWPAGFFDQHRRNTAQLIKPV